MASLAVEADRSYPAPPKQPQVAYLTPEVCIPQHLTKGHNLAIYSGGLGVLAGDLALSAADLGINLTGISIFYKHGYFKQEIDAETGAQVERYPTVIPEGAQPEEVGLTLLRDVRGDPVTVRVPIEDRDVYVGAYQLSVNEQVRWLLLTTDLPENGAEEDYFRMITNHLYGGDLSTRLRQEMALGLGGKLLLQRLGIKPTAYHLNDAHPAFTNMARVEDLLVAQPLTTQNIEIAKHKVGEDTLWTCHTLRPWAMDSFPMGMVEGHFKRNGLDLIKVVVDTLGGVEREEGHAKSLPMFYLARETASRVNAVSQRQAEEIERRWGVSIDYITNGVNLRWVDEDTKQFIDPDQQRLKANHDDPHYIKQRLDQRSDEDFRNFRNIQRRSLVEYINRNIFGENVFDPTALTIGFARRAADYKRLWLLFSQPDRLAQIVSSTEESVQIILATKAHPQDGTNKATIKDIISKIRHNEVLRRHAVFIPDYDQLIAAMITSSDVWLNNPQEGEEASGTSGMKSAAKGGIQWSTKDGWMYEVPDELFFRILDDSNPHVVAERMYRMLEQEIVPAFYNEQGQAVSNSWIERMRMSMGYIIPRFNSQRMVKEYRDAYYIPMSEPVLVTV